MFRKKEYVILLVIAAALIAYIGLQKKDKTHYRLPEVTQLETDKITRIDITSPAGKKTLTRKEERWYLEPEGYLVDSDKIADILKVIGKLNITDLVSSSANYSRYELDDAKKVSVSAWQESSMVRTFDIGKAAPTFQHTYLRFDDDQNVYQAQGHFRLKFDQGADELRDKKVLAFDADEIQSVQLSMEGELLSLQKETVLPSPPESGTAQKTSKAADQDQEKILWRSDKDLDIDQTTVKTLLSDLSELECMQFINDSKPDDLKKPTLQITLKGQEEYNLSVFAPFEGDTDKFPARSSVKDTPFFLSEWKTTSLKEAAQKLMGKEEKPAEPETKEKGASPADPKTSSKS